MEINALKEHLLQLELNLLKPNIRTSREELSQLLADEFFEFGSSGKIWTRKDIVDDEGLGEVKMKLDNFRIHPLSDDTVLATYRIFNEVTLEYTLRSSIWTYQGYRWQMFFHQGTKTNAPV